MSYKKWSVDLDQLRDRSRGRPSEPDGPVIAKRTRIQESGPRQGSDGPTLPRSTGTPLPGDLRRRFEGSLGSSLSSVRVHTGEAAGRAAASIDAAAFTVGKDIFFGRSKYRPRHPVGERVLAHEVAHSVQQGGGVAPRTPLRVTRPGEHVEAEASDAARAMVAGRSCSVTTGALGHSIARLTTAEEMEMEASYGEQLALQDPAPAVMSMSSVKTQSDAGLALDRVNKATGNLRHRQAHFQRLVSEARRKNKNKVHVEVALHATNSYIGHNSSTSGSLQKIIDLARGNAQLDKEGRHLPGHDLRLSTFSGLVAATRVEFRRLEGIVAAFLSQHPDVESGAGSEGGKDLGRAVATGGKDDKSMAQVHNDVKQALSGDPELARLMGQLEASMEAYETANYAGEIDGAVTGIAGKISNMRNVKAELALGTERPEPEDVKKAQAAVSGVNAEVAAAVAAFDQIGSVVKLAVTALAAPQVAALGAGSVLTDAVKTVTDHSVVKTAKQVTDTAGNLQGGLKTATGGAVGDLDVGKDIKTALAKILTNYDTKIDAAKGKLNAANATHLGNIAKLDLGKLNVAKGDVQAAIDQLNATIVEAARQKKAIRDKASEITEHQRNNGKPGQPDIAAMTQALTETTVFVEQADATILQGEKQQEVAKQMADERQKVAGDFQAGQRTGNELNHEKFVTANKQEAFYDCQQAPPFLTSQHPIAFNVHESETGGSVEFVAEAVEKELVELKQYTETAKGFQSNLKRAMFNQ